MTNKIRFWFTVIRIKARQYITLKSINWCIPEILSLELIWVVRKPKKHRHYKYFFFFSEIEWSLIFLSCKAIYLSVHCNLLFCNCFQKFAVTNSAYIKRFQKSNFFIRMINLEIQLIIINFRNDAGHYRKLILNYFTLKSIELSQNPRKYINAMIAITFFRCRKKQLLSDCRQLVPDCLLFSKKNPAKEQKNANKPPRSWERTCYIG